MLASVCGENPSFVPSERLEKYVSMIVLAAWMCDQEAVISAAYHIEYQRSRALAGAEMVAETSRYRLRCVELIRDGFRAARDAVSGLRPVLHQNLLTLSEQDVDTRRTWRF